jgi:hypothetical protein
MTAEEVATLRALLEAARDEAWTDATLAIADRFAAARDALDTWPPKKRRRKTIP